MSSLSQTTEETEFTLPAVHVRHPMHRLWLGKGVKWVRDRNRAILFESNLDALLFCQQAQVSGQITGFDIGGRKIYELDTMQLLA